MEASRLSSFIAQRRGFLVELGPTAQAWLATIVWPKGESAIVSSEPWTH